MKKTKLTAAELAVARKLRKVEADAYARKASTMRMYVIKADGMQLYGLPFCALDDIQALSALKAITKDWMVACELYYIGDYVACDGKVRPKEPKVIGNEVHL